MRAEPLLRSTSARLSLGYAGLILAAFAISGGVIWIATRDTAESELRQSIELEINAIETELKTEGLEAAIGAIKARAEHPGAFEYWVEDAGGHHLAGDFPDMHGPEGWHHVVVREDAPGAERREDMLILTERLPGGIVLSVGDDLGRARAVQDAVLAILTIVGAGALLGSLIFGVLVTRRILSRMALLDATLERVAAGEIAARFPVRGSASDVERVGLAVNAMLDRIERLVSDVRRFSRDIAHDLRTPLTQLQQRLEQAKFAAARADQLEAIEGAQMKVADILRIFDALLRLSEIEAGAARSRVKRLDMAALAEKVADAYRPDVEESGHALALHVSGPCMVLGDEDLLAQAVANLIENAMLHTPPGTPICVRVDTARGHVTLAVIDKGPGIAPGDREHVLEPFARLDQSRTMPGSGLGLSIVAAIARFHSASLVLDDARPGVRASIEFEALRERAAE